MAVLTRVPARRPRALVVAVPLLAVLVTAAVLYLRGGDRLHGAGGGVSGPVTIGEEFHTTVELSTDGGAVELVSARVLGISPGLDVEVSLVDRGDLPTIGSSRGHLAEGSRRLPIEGYRLRGSSASDAHIVLDLQLVATRPGVAQVQGTVVTYRDGFLRERTATLRAPVCLSASSDWRSAPSPIDCGW